MGNQAELCITLARLWQTDRDGLQGVLSFVHSPSSWEEKQ